VLTPDLLAGAYPAPHVYDYGTHRAEQLVLATGAGMMMAAMDALNARWCADIGGQRGLDSCRDWLTASALVVERVWLIGWFTITDPARVFDAIRSCVPEHKLSTYTHPPLDYGIRHATFPEPPCT
jgi:hypothetical protein